MMRPIMWQVPPNTPGPLTVAANVNGAGIGDQYRAEGTAKGRFAGSRQAADGNDARASRSKEAQCAAEIVFGLGARRLRFIASHLLRLVDGDDGAHAGTGGEE